MPSQTLLVPMDCEALVVNPAVRGRDQLRSWPFNYDNLAHFHSPEPPPAETTEVQPATGVYLHWTLPSALREAQQDATTGAIEYPLVPNRWLVVRLQGTTTRVPTAFVLESDCPVVYGVTPGDYAHASQFLIDDTVAALWAASSEPHRHAWKPTSKPGDPAVARIGVRYPLAGWKESAAKAMFLTAVAPANSVFSGYFPHHQNVFGIYDDLADVTADDTLSYYVAGWYSDSAQDPLAGATDDKTFVGILDTLSWNLAAGATGIAASTVCFGACFDIPWQPGATAAAPLPDPLHPDPGDPKHDSRAYLNFSVGNTSIDAFTSLVSPLVGDPETVKLLRAFNYDQLRLLNEVNGEALLEQRIHQEWFGSNQGGSRWLISERSSNGDPVADLTSQESDWLKQLNADQAALDSALASAFALQWKVNALWLKRNVLADPLNYPQGPPPGAPTVAQLDAALDPSGSASPASALIAQLGIVNGLLGRVPQPVQTQSGNRSDAFVAGITAFAQTHLSDDKQLKSVPLDRHWQPNNPTVVISGVQPAYAADPNQSLVVRTDAQLISVLTAGTTISRVTAAAAFPVMGALDALPPVIQPLLDELFLLDAASSPALAAASGISQAQIDAVLASHPPSAYKDTLPAIDLSPWQQPWSPLFLEWRGSHLPIDPGSVGAENWTFDGTDYRYNGRAVTVETQQVGGRSLLSPHAQFLFGSRLKTFLDQFGEDNPELQEIYDEIGKIFEWQFLTQELVGYNDGLATRDARPFRRPHPDDTVGPGKKGIRRPDRRPRRAARCAAWASRLGAVHSSGSRGSVSGDTARSILFHRPLSLRPLWQKADAGVVGDRVGIARLHELPGAARHGAFADAFACAEGPFGRGASTAHRSAGSSCRGARRQAGRRAARECFAGCNSRVCLAHCQSSEWQSAALRSRRQQLGRSQTRRRPRWCDEDRRVGAADSWLGDVAR
jgi:hypothetical protein